MPSAGVPTRPRARRPLLDIDLLHADGLISFRTA